MNAKRLWALEEFIEHSKSWILTDNPRLSDIRSRAETELGFKCAPDPIKDCMNRHGIPVRRSKMEAQKQAMMDRIVSLESLVLDMFAHGNLPPKVMASLGERHRKNLPHRVAEHFARYAEDFARYAEDQAKCDQD